MNINHISISRKKLFDDCEKRYYYRYHKEVPSPVPEQFYFVYGKIVHKIAEIYVKNKGEQSLKDIAISIIRKDIPIENDKFCPPLPLEYQKKLQKHLRAIKNLTDQIGVEGITEYKFEYDLDPPNKKNVLGFIDRLIIKNNKAFIIDYKTTKKGKFRVNRETVRDDLQLKTYARVVQREFKIPPENIKAALYYLEGEEIVAAQFSQESLLEVEEELKRAYYYIESKDPNTVWGNVTWQCKNCEYNSICPFYSKSTSSKKEVVWDGSLDVIDPWK